MTNIGSKESVGIFVIARMVLKATVQKQSSKQSPPKVSSKAFLKTDFLKNFQKKAPVLDSLSDKFAGLKADNFIKNRLQHSVFLLILQNV